MFKKIYVLYLIVFISITIFGFIIANYGINNQDKHIYVLPNGYTGWVKIVYDQKDSPPLIREGRNYVNLIPANGILRTSNPSTSGVMEVYYLDEQGNRNKLPSDMIQSRRPKVVEVQRSDGTFEDQAVYLFFIGTKEQWKEEMLRNP